MTTRTLTSLAILKVNLDRNVDYLDYLLPFISQVIIDNDIDQIDNISNIRNHIRSDFGLEIPERTIEIVLRRMAKKQLVKRESHSFIPTENLTDPRISSERKRVEHEIQIVLDELKKFSKTTNTIISDSEEATKAICTFLSKFDITCLKAYLQGTVIPDLADIRHTDIVLVGNFVQYIQKNNLDLFNKFMKLVQGHMLANALTCPDLENVSSTYRGMTFYLDTPLLIQRLGLEGEPRQKATRDLILLLTRLKANIAIFSHTLSELKSVLRGAAHFLDDPKGRGTIINEARKNETSKSDLLLLAESAEDKLVKYGIEIIDTPSYIEDYQIDELIFADIIDENLMYNNPRAKEYDINSVRSIYALRANKRVLSLEKSIAVLVTSNTAFAKAAWEYDKQSEESYEVSSVISDFSLANMAWLKAPMGASSLPTTQVLAFSYAAMQPSAELLTKYMAEIDRLEKSGDFNELEHQLLRSSPHIVRGLMHYSLGDAGVITAVSIVQVFEKFRNELREEEAQKLVQEEQDHIQTRRQLSDQQDQYQHQLQRNQELMNNIYWKCDRKSKQFAQFLNFIFAVFFMFIIGLGILIGLPGIDFPLWLSSSILLILGAVTYVNSWTGKPLRNARIWIQDKYLIRQLRYEAKTLDLDLGELYPIQGNDNSYRSSR